MGAIFSDADIAPPPKRILWWGNVRGLTYKQRLAFASKHGFDALNISPFDVVALLETGETLSSIKAMADDAGQKLTYLDPIVSWLPDWRPIGAAEEMIPFLEAGLGRELEFAQALGIDRLLTITAFPEGRYNRDEIAQRLYAFADKAASLGMVCVLEAMPMWGLKRFADVVDVWRRIDRPDVKLMFDTWHYCRGGRSDHLISELPSGAIDHVQFADGTAAKPNTMTLFEDCLYHRLPIGEGALPIDDLAKILAAAGHLNSVGPEVFSRIFDELPADQLAAALMPGFENVVSKHCDNLSGVGIGHG
ncbi:sugar phosphate isomerase/epimerase family protein [Pseudahrensia aquimaris]|uniref:Sugar phosphate isomerase/epimerase family protein n=1 Tax=Pseudahrensia aquimaris TaxID=744461 RepID=A0ABW3FBY0_9HYPH